MSDLCDGLSGNSGLGEIDFGERLVRTGVISLVSDFIRWYGWGNCSKFSIDLYFIGLPLLFSDCVGLSLCLAGLPTLSFFLVLLGLSIESFFFSFIVAEDYCLNTGGL